MKLLLVNAINRGRRIEGSFEPLGLAYLAGAVRSRMPGCEIRINDHDPRHVLSDWKPDVAGISAVSQNFNIAEQYCGMAKAAGAMAIVGGVHISMLPESLPESADLGLRGEGEAAFPLLLETLDSAGMDAKKCRDVPGVVFRDRNGEVRSNDPMPLIHPLDSLATPARDLLNIPEDKSAYLFSSRGCPYDCVFCASTRFWGARKVRFFSAERTADEVEGLVDRYWPKFISFKDDLFIADKKRLARIVDLLERKDIPSKTSFFVSCRANLIDDQVADLLSRMNVRQVSMGLESGCDRTLSYLKGGSVTVEQNRLAIETLSRRGIGTFGSFVIGSPQETREDMDETYRFIAGSKLDGFLVYTLTPFPGTPIWDHARTRDLVGSQMDWSRLAIDFSDDPFNKIVVSESLSRRDLFGIYRRFISLQRRFENRRRLKTLMSHPADFLRRAAGLRY